MRHMDSEPACRHYVWNLGLDYWNPPEGREDPQEYEDRLAQAQAICNTCPLKETCHETALRLGEAQGIWGGVDMEPRRREDISFAESRQIVNAMGQEGNHAGEAA